MPLLHGIETMVLYAALARRDVELRASSWGVAEPLIHVSARPMSIMIGIDETRADHAARIGTRHHDDDNNSCGARAPCAPHGGSGAFMLYMCLR